MKTGLASVTFRKLAPAEIVKLAAQAGLDGIEWGGDAHVPPGDLEAARTVRDMTARAGLAVASYGSYYRAGKSAGEGLVFETVLATARALGAPIVRAWAGTQASAEVSPESRAALAAELRRLGDAARAEGILVALEFHSRTLTDTAESAAQLMRETEHPHVRLYWQPPVGRAGDECCADLRRLAGYLTHLHVQSHDPISRARQSLAAGAPAWRRYLEIAAASPAARHYALLEFVAGGTMQQFLEDAAVLRRLAAAI